MSQVGRILCFQPCYSGGEPASHKAFWTASTKPGSPFHGKTDLTSFGGSLLANCFNQALAGAYNMQDDDQDTTHFAMLHDDVCPDNGWLDVLMEELISHDADVMCALVPIKDPMGITSTAIDDPKDIFDPERRISLHEAYKLPPTFDSSDCGYPGRKILGNTGCWVADITKPFWKEMNPDGTLKIRFNIQDRIRRHPVTKRWVADVASEDWNFTRDVQAAGGKVMVTRKVGLGHTGKLPFNNREPWGVWHEDLPRKTKFHNQKIAGHPRTKDDSDPVDDVEGWITTNEGKTLSKAVKGMTVIEIGSYLGRSTIYLARTAKKVYAVDTFDGRGTPLPRLTREAFKANLIRYGVMENVVVMEGTSEEMVPKCGEVDCVFIDGSHEYMNVKQDIALAMGNLSCDGILIFHDYRSEKDPGVTQAVDEFLALNGGEIMGNIDTIIVVKPKSFKIPRPQYEYVEPSCPKLVRNGEIPVNSHAETLP